MERQTLKNAKRYTTSELKKLENKIVRAEDQINELEYEIFCTIREKVVGKTLEILETAKTIAYIDVLACFAEISEKYNYCRPKMNIEDKIVIKTSLELDQGIEDVEKSIQEIVFGKQFEINNDEIVSNSRHIALLNLAYNNIVDAISAANDRMPYDFIEVDIKDSITHLGNITGEAVEKDLLNSIFSNFCLGK